jgi:hypothetical protein
MLQVATHIRDSVRAARTGNSECVARCFTLFLQPVPEDKLFEREKHYKYAFRPGRAQYDPTLQILKVITADLVGKSFKVASVKYKIFSSDDAPAVFPPSQQNSFSATKFYTIKDEEMFPMTVAVIILPRYPRCAPPIPETIHVWWSGKWELFKDWLPARVVDSRPLTGKSGLWTPEPHVAVQ